MSLIDNGEAFIKRNAKLMWRKTANSREEMPEYVERSYHEALVNALAHSLHWEHYFQHIIQKYNNTYKVQIPVITPHVCRHTYCSNMAKSGMNPKALQYLMGHSDISVTLNTYTHVNLEDAREEIARIQVV